MGQVLDVVNCAPGFGFASFCGEESDLKSVGVDAPQRELRLKVLESPTSDFFFEGAVFDMKGVSPASVKSPFLDRYLKGSPVGDRDSMTREENDSFKLS